MYDDPRSDYRQVSEIAKDSPDLRCLQKKFTSTITTLAQVQIQVFNFGRNSVWLPQRSYFYYDYISQFSMFRQWVRLNRWHKSFNI